jgi:hypothetical protein
MLGPCSVPACMSIVKDILGNIKFYVFHVLPVVVLAFCSFPYIKLCFPIMTPIRTLCRCQQLVVCCVYTNKIGILQTKAGPTGKSAYPSFPLDALSLLFSQ